MFKNNWKEKKTNNILLQLKLLQFLLLAIILDRKREKIVALKKTAFYGFKNNKGKLPISFEEK